MSLPTAHSYIIQGLRKSLDDINDDFLDPKKLVKHLSNMETLLTKDVQILENKDFSKNIDKEEKLELSKILDKVEFLEKSANQKISWANGFSKFLEIQKDSK